MRIFLVPVRATQVVFGDDLAGSRMAHALFGTITVVAMFGFGRRLIGDFAAWCAALLLATSHVHVHFSRVIAAASTQSAAAFALIMWGLTRMRDPRSGVGTWIATGLALGWGVQTYQLAFGYPVLLVCTVWAWRGALPTRRWWLILLVVFASAAPVCFDWAWWYWQNYPQSVEHVASVSVTSRNFRPQAGQDWETKISEHIRRGLTMFWSGRDPIDNYAASIPVLDPVTGVLFAAGIAYTVWNWRTPTSQFVAIWFPALMIGAVFLASNNPSYHRLSAPLLCVFLVSAWVLSDVAHWLVRPAIARSIVTVLIGIIAYLNLHYTFVQYPAESRNYSTSQALVMVRRICQEPVLSDADRAYLLQPGFNYPLRVLRLQCPNHEKALMATISPP